MQPMPATMVHDSPDASISYIGTTFRISGVHVLSGEVKNMYVVDVAYVWE